MKPSPEAECSVRKQHPTAYQLITELNQQAEDVTDLTKRALGIKQINCSYIMIIYEHLSDKWCIL